MTIGERRQRIDRAEAGEAGRAILFLVLGAFILLGPAAGQIFGYRSAWLRSWVMFSEVGVGIQKGEYRLTGADGTVSVLSPLEIIGITRYPPIRYYEFEKRIGGPADLHSFGEAFCAGLSAGQTLSFDGAVGTRAGWKPVSVANVCADRVVRLGSGDR